MVKFEDTDIFQPLGISKRHGVKSCTELDELGTSCLHESFEFVFGYATSRKNPAVDRAQMTELFAYDQPVQQFVAANQSPGRTGEFNGKRIGKQERTVVQKMACADGSRNFRSSAVKSWSQLSSRKAMSLPKNTLSPGGGVMRWRSDRVKSYSKLTGIRSRGPLV